MRGSAEFAWVVPALAVLMGGCDSADQPVRVPAPGPYESVLAQSNNAFALDLYAKLREQKGNLFLSPYSISSALAMTYAGARGQTAAQMGRALHFDSLGPDQLHAAFSDFREVLDATGKMADCELAVANALWVQKSYPFLKSFLDLTRLHYGAKAAGVDFQAESEPARLTINRWVAERTRGRIEEITPPGAIDAVTRLVLTNAIYFKGVWASEFRKSYTGDAPFTLLSGEKIEVPMMHQISQFRYAHADGVQVIDMPYRGAALSMVILLPTKADGLAKIELSLSEERLSGWLRAPDLREVAATIPRFKLAASFSLEDALKSLGMIDAFGEDADFAAMTFKEGLFISAVLHQAQVDVAEKGTEAAAATVVCAKPGTGKPGMHERPVEFRADHPFLFLIGHARSGAILFLGRVMNPKE